MGYLFENKNVIFDNSALKMTLLYLSLSQNNMFLPLGASINDVFSEGEGGGPPQEPMKGDENRYLILGKADMVYDLPKNL